MTVEVYTGSAWKPADTLQIYTGSAWKNADMAWVYTGSAWAPFFTDSATMTTGNNTIFFPGSKGVAFYTLNSYGYTPGGTFVDVPDAYYSLSYPAFGNISGQVIGSTGSVHSVYECIYHYFTNETPLFNMQLIITVTGNLTNKTYTPYIDGTAIAGAKTGSYDGTYTKFRWDEGITRAGSTIPGNDTSTPDSNPFGSNGTTHKIELL